MRPLMPLLLFHGISAAIETGGHRPVIVGTLLDQLSFRHAGRRVRRIIAGLAHGPTMTLITIGCLFLLALALAGIDEDLAG